MIINNTKQSEHLSHSLQKSGMRLTPQRIAICNYLASREDHPTAADIYQHLKSQYTSLSLATVYNTLDVLVALGEINALGNAGDGMVHFDPRTDPHINLACVQCHEITDIASPHIQQMNAEIKDTSGYRLLGSRVLYYGVCPDCQTK